MADERRLSTGFDTAASALKFLRATPPNPLDIELRDIFGPEPTDMSLVRNIEQIIFERHFGKILDRLVPSSISPSEANLHDEARRVQGEFTTTLESYLGDVQDPAERRLLRERTSLTLLTGFAQEQYTKAGREVGKSDLGSVEKLALEVYADRARLVYEILSTATPLL